MKTVQVRKNVFLFLGALSFLTVLLSGCLKQTTTSTTPPKTFLSLMHLASRSPAVDVYFDNTKASQPFNPGTVSSSYSSLDPAIFAINFKKSGGDSLVAGLASNFYDTLRHYTLLLYNYDTAHVRALRIEDDFSVLVNQQKAHYRFFHMSSDIGPVDLYFDNTLIESGRQYADNTVSNYYNQFFEATPSTYNIVIKKAGSDSVIAQQNSMFMGAGSAYTLYLKGIPGKTGANGLGVDFLQALD